MRSLFLKIFLWFWLGMILANVALFLSVAATRPSQPSRPWRDASVAGLSARRAADIYDQSGSEALDAYLKQFESTTGIYSVLMNEQGKELSDRALPSGGQELADRAAKSGVSEFNVSGASVLVARQVVTPKGHTYIYVSRVPRTPFTVSLRAQALRLLAV